MATASNSSPHLLIDQRLDTLDRALLGLLPRSERLAIVADVEAKILCAHAANPTVVVEATAVDEPANEVVASTGRRLAGRRRSRLALTSGIMGIVALTLLFISPVTYFVVAAMAEMLGEIFAYGLLGINVLVVSLGGAAAVVFGITALVRLSRRQGQQVGHGWAITGLCTGPVPMLVGGLVLLTFGLPLLSELVVQRSPAGVPASNMAETTIPPLAPPASMPSAAPAVWNTSAPASFQAYGAPDCTKCAPAAVTNAAPSNYAPAPAAVPAPSSYIPAAVAPPQDVLPPPQDVFPLPIDPPLLDAPLENAPFENTGSSTY